MAEIDSAGLLLKEAQLPEETKNEEKAITTGNSNHDPTTNTPLDNSLDPTLQRLLRNQVAGPDGSKMLIRKWKKGPKSRQEARPAGSKSLIAPKRNTRRNDLLFASAFTFDDDDDDNDDDEKKVDENYVDDSDDDISVPWLRRAEFAFYSRIPRFSFPQYSLPKYVVPRYLLQFPGSHLRLPNCQPAMLQASCQHAILGPWDSPEENDDAMSTGYSASGFTHVSKYTEAERSFGTDNTDSSYDSMYMMDEGNPVHLLLRGVSAFDKIVIDRDDDGSNSAYSVEDDILFRRKNRNKHFTDDSTFLSSIDGSSWDSDDCNTTAVHTVSHRMAIFSRAFKGKNASSKVDHRDRKLEPIKEDITIQSNRKGTTKQFGQSARPETSDASTSHTSSDSDWSSNPDKPHAKKGKENNIRGSFEVYGADNYKKGRREIAVRTAKSKKNTKRKLLSRILRWKKNNKPTGNYMIYEGNCVSDNACGALPRCSDSDDNDSFTEGPSHEVDKSKDTSLISESYDCCMPVQDPNFDFQFMDKFMANMAVSQSKIDEDADETAATTFTGSHTKSSQQVVSDIGFEVNYSPDQLSNQKDDIEPSLSVKCESLNCNETTGNGDSLPVSLPNRIFPTDEGVGKSACSDLVDDVVDSGDVLFESFDSQYGPDVEDVKTILTDGEGIDVVHLGRKASDSDSFYAGYAENDEEDGILFRRFD